MGDILDILRRHSTDTRAASVLPKLTLLRSDTITEPSATSYSPLFCMLASGRKRVWLGSKTLVYGPADYLITSADLPLTSQVIEAPYFGFSLNLDPKVIAEVMLSVPPVVVGRVATPGAAVARAEDELFDAVTRLLRLLDHPRQIPLIAPMVEREIIFRLLEGRHGDALRQLAAPASPLSQVRRAISWIQAHYSEAFSIAKVARVAGMSQPTFHRHFRAVTNLSPLQFQKRLRLEEARRRLLVERADVATIAFDLGYESPSQFNREYRRLFGAPPRRDMIGARRMLLDPAAS